MIQKGDHVTVICYATTKIYRFVADRWYNSVVTFYDAMNKKHDLHLKDSQCMYMNSTKRVEVEDYE